MKIIFDYNRTIYNPETGALYDGVLDLLADLSSRHVLFLVSKLEPVRLGMIQELGIKDFFREVHFVEQKTPELFLKLADGDSDVLVVGDRVRAEIMIGNMLGFNTVWTAQGLFGNEGPISDIELPKHKIDNILDLKEIIKIYE